MKYPKKILLGNVNLPKLCSAFQKSFLNKERSAKLWTLTHDCCYFVADHQSSGLMKTEVRFFSSLMRSTERTYTLSVCPSDIFFVKPHGAIVLDTAATQQIAVYFDPSKCRESGTQYSGSLEIRTTSDGVIVATCELHAMVGPILNTKLVSQQCWSEIYNTKELCVEVTNLFPHDVYVEAFVIDGKVC
jgi:hypothetical protein